jgi:hypothetical protein
VRLSARLELAQQFRQVSDLDGFERTHGALDLPAEARVEAAGHDLVELLDRVFSREGMGSEARVVLDLVLDHIPALQPDRDLDRHLVGVWVRILMVWPDRNLLQQCLHVGPDDAIRLELRRHHVTIEEGHCEQVLQPVLSRAMRMLAGREHIDERVLTDLATEIENDPTIIEAFLDDDATELPPDAPLIGPEDGEELVQEDFGYTATWAGVLISPGGMVTMAMMFVAGRLVGKIQPKYSITPFEETAPAGTETTFHLHRNCDEVAHVLSGEITFEIGDRSAGRASVPSCRVACHTLGKTPATKQAVCCLCIRQPRPAAFSRNSWGDRRGRPMDP